MYYLKKLKSFLQLSILFFLIFSCTKNEIPPATLEMRDSLIYKIGSDLPFTGKEKAVVEGKIIEYDVVEGMRHGDFRFYYENGNLEVQGQMDHNENIGKWHYYFMTGELESEGHFVDNKPEGKWTWYFPSGKIMEEGIFINGKRIGLWKQFDEQGNLTIEKEFLLDDSITTEENYLDKFRNN
ncbi:MAG: toxin-antitoxin system YwqK family antitoxin [Bacteroidetes bacterium]|nr:toxin-antitoxin system YwqK family antitoxin [Bacteroidota bacterium]